MALHGRSILLVIGGGIAAYKSLDLIRRLRDAGARVRAILTKGGAEFITPLSVSSLTGQQTFTDLFSLKDEVDMGHIRLSREADLIIVAPATADLMARMAHGRADDLAATTLLASNAPILLCPAMNAEMWAKPATQRNVKQLEADGIHRLGPATGGLACGEHGAGRLSETGDILDWAETFFAGGNGPLAGRHAIVTAGPTHEPIDPVRFIANRSSGRMGYAIAGALAGLGAGVTLVSGPVALDPPAGVRHIPVETAAEMDAAVQGALPADIAVCVAAVSDWTPKDKKDRKAGKADMGDSLALSPTPDILAGLASRKKNRPGLVIGFAAETGTMLKKARAKRDRKGCDWIVANDVGGADGAMGGKETRLVLVRGDGETDLGRGSKETLARDLARAIAAHFEKS